jgi:predicted KAP-like P-loop ATPase
MDQGKDRMMNTQQPHTKSVDHPFSADRPIRSKKDDLLGRADFAVALADAIRGWRQDESLVVSIHGRWGSGKTSFKYMVLETLAPNTVTGPHVVEFNPWQWSSQSQIAEAFFREIGLKLGVAPKGKAEQELAIKWQAYASYLDFGSEALTWVRKLLLAMLTTSAVVLGSAGFITHPALKTVAIVIASLCAVGAAVLGFSKAVAEKLSQVLSARAVIRQQSLEETREGLQQSMAKLERPILVVLDDIDRLTPCELKLVFQLVKSNADFPNLIYLLLFQRDIVEKSLEEGPDRVSVVKGRDYLEKIVNVGFDLPMIEQSKVDRFIGDKLDRLFGDAEVSESDNQRFANLYWGPLQHFFRDLRDAKRFLATLDFHLGLFRARGVLDVNVVDLFALEVLRVFESDAYGQLPLAKQLLTRDSDRISNSEHSEMQATVDGILEKADEANRDQVRDILKEMFPLTQVLFGGHSYSGGFEEEWFRDRRVCHADVFDRYFLLRTADGDVSHGDIQRLLDAAGDKERLLAELRNLDERGLLATMMNRFEAYKQKVPLEYAVPFVAAFLDLGDEIPDDSGVYFLSPVHHAARIIYWFLKQEPDQTKRGELFLNAARKSRGVFLVAMEAQSNNRKEADAKKREDTELFLLDEKSSEELNELALDRIREAAESGALVKSTRLQYLLYRWKAWGGAEEPTAWLRSVISNDDGLRHVLVEFLSRSTSHTIGDRVERVHWKYDLKDLEEYVSADDIELRLNQLDMNTFTPMEQIAVEQFKKALCLKRAGKPYGLNQMW